MNFWLKFTSTINCKFIVILLTVLFCGRSLPAAAQDQSSQVKAFAQQVWETFDSADYAKMYDSMFDVSMQQQATKEQWIQTAQATAQQRGKMISRTLASQTSSMGIYKVTFSSQCAGGKVFEDTFVTKRPGGWKVTGIFVRANLE